MKFVHQAIEDLLAAVSPNLLLALQVKFKAESLNHLMGKNFKNGVGFEVNLKTDFSFMKRLKEIIIKKIENSTASDTGIPEIVALLFEEVKLDASFKKPEDMFQELGFSSLPNATGPLTELKQSGAVQEVMNNFLPPETKELITLFKTHGLAIAELSLNTPLLGMSIEAKLGGIQEIFDLVL